MSLKSRACLACYGIGTLFTALSGRLIYLAVIQHEHYAEIARKSYLKTEILPARRGGIQDADGNSLAQNEPLKNVILDGKLITGSKRNKSPKEIADLIAGTLGLNPDDVLKRISPDKKYVVLKKKISEELAADLDRKVQEAGIKGVTFEQNFERIYPARQMLCHVVGFYGYEDARQPGGEGSFRGIEGVERSMDTWLAGQDGWRCFEKDGRGKELMNLTGEVRAPRNGANVRLTVNLNLQQIVESELEAACKRLRPAKATVIMMKPDTGEILALANRPNFDPNEAGKAKPEERFNNAIAGTVEPGSTFKAVTCASALNYHLVTPKTEVFCENGKWAYGGLVLSDHAPYGMLSVSQIIEKSSNIGAAKLAIQIGQERFYGCIRNFGFGQQTGVALPGEVRGILRPREKWEPVSITRVAMGHEVGATPLQIITATCAIANGGTLMMPQIVHEIRDDSGAVLSNNQPQEVRRVITEDTAVKVRDALIKVTGKQGTAKAAHIPGYNVAGKTGTAQKLLDDPKTGKKFYSHDHHVTSFVGFVPAEKPAFCLLVIFDDAKVPSHEDYGGTLAAPVFRTIAERALLQLGVEPNPVLLQQEKNQNLILAKAGRN
jgi:cell division protein FtsI/penicillin-binding protein 2